MKSAFVLVALLVAATPAAAQQGFCSYGQSCQNAAPVPFPVINPVQGLSNLLTLPLGQDQTPSSPPSWTYAPIATPPPVMPPAMPASR